MKNKNKEYQAIKVPRDTYESLKDLKNVIIQQGLNSVSDELINYTPKYCPKCGSEMESIEVKAGFHYCTNCKFKFPKFELGLGGSLALGTLIGLGIAGIIYLLTKDRNKD